jgi:hypothetical protein
MQHQWNDNSEEKAHVLGETLHQLHFFHHKFDMDYPGILFQTIFIQIHI